MKPYLSKFFLSLGAVVALNSCREDAFPGGEDITPRPKADKICFVVSDKGASRGSSDGSCRTGGAFIYNADRTDSLYVRLTIDNQENLTTSRAAHITESGYNPLRATCLRITEEGKSYYFSDTRFTKNTAGLWISEPIYWWLNDNSHLKFYGYAPADAEGATYITDEQSWQPKLDYQVPADVTAQSDIIYNTLTQEYIATEQQAVPLTMAHALANVAFSTGLGMSAGTINTVTVKNVLGHGTLNLTDGQWALDPESVTDFSLTLGKNSSDNLEITNDPDKSYFMLLPGCNSKETMLEIEFTKATGEIETYSAPLTDTWEAGKQYKYTFAIDPDFNITVDTNPQDAHYVICKATVDIANLQQGQEWELTAEASDGADVTLLPESELNKFQKQGFWTDRFLFQADGTDTPKDRGSARGEHTLQGSASGDVYVFLPENTSNDNREISLSLKVKGAKNIVAEQTITQVHPDWNDFGFGWEQFENDPPTQWGFKWDRQVTYVKINVLLNWVYGPMIEDLIAQYNASSYAFIDQNSLGFLGRTKVTITYSSLNDLSSLDLNNNDGLQNTRKLFDFAGGAVTGELEQAIEDLAPGPLFQCGTFDKTETGSNITTSAAIECILKKNKYDYVQIEKQDAGATVITDAAVIKKEDIVWFLPAIAQFQSPPQVYQLDGDYWSSTPDGTENAFTCNGTASRTDYRKIRACRKR